jgi:hypothetical protein
VKRFIGLGETWVDVEEIAAIEPGEVEVTVKRAVDSEPKEQQGSTIILKSGVQLSVETPVQSVLAVIRESLGGKPEPTPPPAEPLPTVDVSDLPSGYLDPFAHHTHHH